MMAGTGAVLLSLLLDVIPVLAMIFLGISFLRRRSECRREEQKLREEIRLFRERTERQGVQDE